MWEFEICTFTQYAAKLRKNKRNRIMKLLILEKLAAYKELVGVIPDIDVYDVVFTHGIGLWRYKLPRLCEISIPFDGVPQGVCPQSMLPPVMFIRGSGVMLRSCSSDTEIERNVLLDGLVGLLRASAPMYEEVIVAVEPDRVGVGGANQLLDAFKERLTVKVKYAPILSHERGSLMKVWSNRGDVLWGESPSVESLLQQNDVKRLFDYRWSVNSFSVFGAMMKSVGVPAKRALSKFELMVLCILANHRSGVKQGALIKIMCNWGGTGKYSIDDCAGIGTPKSYAPILRSLLDHGLIHERSERLALSSAGLSFIEKLHPKTFDPDLPFRLNMWAKAGDVDSSAKYLRKLFSRQLRFQSAQK